MSSIVTDLYKYRLALLWMAEEWCKYAYDRDYPPHAVDDAMQMALDAAEAGVVTERSLESNRDSESA